MNDQKARWLEEYCHVCGRQLNSWDARVSNALGYRHKLCEACIADEYKIELDELRSTLEHHFGMRPCLGL